MPRKGTHVIEEYKARADTILCVCDWFGPSKEFKQHRLDNRDVPTDYEPDTNTYNRTSNRYYVPDISEGLV